MPLDAKRAFQARDIMLSIPGVSPETPCGVVFQVFAERTDLACLAVLDGEGRPLGVIERERMLATFARDLMADLYRRRPVTAFLNKDFLEVDGGVDLDEVTALIASRYPAALTTGFIITQDQRYAGVGTGIGLLSKVVELTRTRALDLAEAQAAAEAANRAKSGFLASMSHELRTPLNGVVGSLELLRYADGEEERGELIAAANTAAETLLQIIGAVLDFSKIESDRIELEAIALDPAALIAEVTSLFASAARQRGVRIQMEVGLGIPRVVIGDPLRLKQVIMNFVGNALKFTGDGVIAVSLRRVWSAAPATVLRVEVADTGAGFDPDKASSLFDAFSQEDSSTTRRFGGTGLGLAISKRLIELMGGSIGADGSPGGGASFWIEMPVTAPADESDLVPPRLDDVRVLVVDSNGAARAGARAVADALGRAGAGVEIAGGWASALAALRERRFGAVVVDDQLSEERALRVAEVAGEIKVPLVLTHALEGRALARRLLGRGAGALVVTPCPAEEVAHAVACVLGLGALGQGGGTGVASGAPTVRDLRGRAGGRPILVIDDTAMNLNIVRRQLDKLGVGCDTVEDGLTGLDLLQTKDYALVLVDVSMPIIDGYEFTRRLRAREAERGGRRPVLAMTANAQIEDVHRSLDAGMDDHLTKPLTLQRLADALERWLGEDRPAPSPTTPPESIRAESIRAGSIRAGSVEVLAVAGPAPVDLVALAAMLGGAEDDELREILGDFVAVMPDLLARMDAALAANDRRGLRDAAHAAKGAARNACAVALGDVMESLETGATAEEMEALDAWAQRARAGFEEIDRFLGAW